jgi:quinol monooxygenase YgiN
VFNGIAATRGGRRDPKGEESAVIVVAANMVVKPGVRDQFDVAVGELSRLTRDEDGCDSYECYQSLENADSYLF